MQMDRYLGPGEVEGHVVTLRRSDPRHLSGTQAPAQPAAATESFGRLLSSALSDVNDLQINSMNLAQRMVTDPDSVDIHDLTIAMAEANLSLSMTKALADRAIRAYREIISVR
jgi:flagellar hook-basal body complex protein FliE